MIRILFAITSILCLGTGSFITAFSQNVRKCTIKELIGTVKIRRGASIAWNDARPKMVLNESDAIRTLIESEAELEINDGSLIRIEENTTIELKLLKGGDDQNNTSVKVMNGNVLANIKKLVSPASSFEFETPTATAAIRGTTLGLEVTKNQTIVKVYEGKVLVTPTGSKEGVELQRYQVSTITKGIDKVKVSNLDEKSPVPFSTNKTDTATRIDSVRKTDDTLHQMMDTAPESIKNQYKPAIDTQSQSIEIQRSSSLIFSVSTPSDGQLFNKPLIAVNGNVTPGAEVTVMSIRLPVTSSGNFSGQIPIANESGELTLEFEASLGGSTRKIVRHVVYKPEYRFVLTSPLEGQTVSSTEILVKGEVVPSNAEVSVQGKRLTVNSNGGFVGYVSIPDEEGEVIIDFEVSFGGINKNEVRRIHYKRPPDTFRPQITAVISKNCWKTTVFDRTPEEEITLWYEIDGNREFRILQPNESVCIPLENGVHSYRVYAEDKAKNRSSIETLNNHPYLSTTNWLIKMRKPSGNITIDIPPSSPAGEVPYYPLEFTVENLPQDNMILIREINVTNKTNGKRISIRTFTDNFIETEIELVRGRSNQIQIDVNDINNVIKSWSFQINVR